MKNTSAMNLGEAIAEVLEEKTREDRARYLNTEQAAQHLGFALITVQAWRYQGRGPSYIKMENGAVRYDREELDRWMKNQEVANDA